MPTKIELAEKAAACLLTGVGVCTGSATALGVGAAVGFGLVTAAQNFMNDNANRSCIARLAKDAVKGLEDLSTRDGTDLAAVVSVMLDQLEAPKEDEVIRALTSRGSLSEAISASFERQIEAMDHEYGDREISTAKLILGSVAKQIARMPETRDRTQFALLIHIAKQRAEDQGRVERLLQQCARALDAPDWSALLPDPRSRRPQDSLLVGALAPRYQVVPTNGRDAEEKDYLSWCDDDAQALAVRLMTGGSGRGKTRFMIDTCGTLRDDHEDWIAGFLTPDMQTDPSQLPFLRPGNLLIAVDYAETRRKEVQSLLKAALRAVDQGRSGRIRIVLIARSRTEVFDNILNDRELEDRASVQAAELPLDPVPDPKAFYALACEALSVPQAARAYPDGLNADFGILSLAALLAATEGVAAPQDAAQVMTKLLGHEERYWQNAADHLKVPGDLLAAGGLKLAAAAFTFFGLQGAIPDASAGADLLQQLPLFADRSHAECLLLTKVFAQLYPHSAGCIEGVTLDLFGDHLMASYRHSHAPLIELFRPARELPPRCVTSALTRMTWIGQRAYGDVAQSLVTAALHQGGSGLLGALIATAPEAGDPLGRLAEPWAQEALPADEALALMKALPHHSLALRELSAQVTGKALEGDELSDELRAGVLNNLANRLSALGDREAALTAAQEAVDLYRALADARPDAFTPNLATSLNNLASRLSDLGDREAALTVAQEAVDLRRALADARPDAFTPDLATSLGALSQICAGSEDWRGTQGATKEALGLITPFVVKLPQAFAPLAAALGRDYIQACEKLGEAPDEALLSPVVAALEALQAGGS